MTSRSTVHLKLEPQLELRLQRLATAHQRSADALMHEAVEQYVSREERREQFRNDALAAWKHYEATGLHVTDEEADAWLARLEKGEDAKAPECHV